ncbi:MAG: hypothetical protein ABFS19_07900 [Thermodesulfobacteriota bacterium]
MLPSKQSTVKNSISLLLSISIILTSTASVFAESFQISPGSPFLLAANQSAQPDSLPSADSQFNNDGKEGSQAKDNDFHFGGFHKYLGYATLLFATAAGATGSSGDSFHEAMGHSTAGFAALTAATGLLEYSGDYSVSDGFTLTNIHALLGSLATVGFIANTFSADSDGHGGVPMAAAGLAFGAGIIIHF